MTFADRTSWGAAVTAVAAHGPAERSDLSAWLDRQGSSAAPTATGAGTSAGDLALAASLGLDAVRLTLDWSRLEPEPGRHDDLAIESARATLAHATEAGLSPWACLHDGPLPGWFSVDEHGFADRRARQYFWSRHVEFVGEAFSDLVHGWVPMVEPTRWAWQGWMDAAGPPGRHGDGPRFAEHLEGALLAGVDAALRLRQDAHPVAAAHQLTPVFAARDHHDQPATADAQVEAEALDRTLNRCWLDLLATEELQVGGRPPVAVPDARRAYDLIGVTYRHAVATRGDGSVVPYPGDAGHHGAHRAWPEGLALALERVAQDAPQRPIAVGVAVRAGSEGEREQHLRESLRHVEAAVDAGIDVTGIWWETPVDPAPGPRGPGLFDHDRRARSVADLLARTIATGTVPG